MAALRRIALFLVGGWLVLCGVAYVVQRKLQYFPDKGPVPLPDRPGLVEVKLRTSDGVDLDAWHWKGRKPLTLLVFHGNAGHRGHRMDFIEGFHRSGWGVFLLDYRGYGGSGGSPTEEGFYKDADAALAYVEKQGGKVVYLGRSIGSAVAMDLASRTRPAGLIVDSGALSMADVARTAYRFLPIGLLMKDRFDCAEKIKRIECPLLALHGGLDRIIPIGLGVQLHAAFPGKKKWVELTGDGHNSPRGRAYYDAVDEFLSSLP